VNAADIVGHEEIIYEGDVEDEDGEWIDEDDDGEWVDEDDDGEWVDEDDDGEWVDEDDDGEEEEEIKKPEINNKTTTIKTDTPFKKSFELPTHSTPLPEENKPKVLPDSVLERIFREVDPQTMVKI